MTAVQVSGDFFLDPASALDDIDAALEGLPVETGETALAAAVTATLDRETQLFGITPEGVAVAVRRALDADRKSAVEGKEGSVRVTLGGCRMLKKKKTNKYKF